MGKSPAGDLRNISRHLLRDFESGHTGLGPANILSEEEKYQILGHVGICLRDWMQLQEQDFLTKSVIGDRNGEEQPADRIEEYEATSCPVGVFP